MLSRVQAAASHDWQDMPQDRLEDGFFPCVLIHGVEGTVTSGGIHSPHSTFPRPGHRPARSFSPSSTGSVHGQNDL
jgi:hypothetical protein